MSATRFMSGKFPFMIFGLPGAALAMYTTAKREKRRIAGGLLLSASLTAMLTGITEPIEFTFLFVAPVLYLFHSLFAGLSYMFTHVFNVGVGMTFSGGIIDLLLFGVLQGNEKTRWMAIIPIGIAYFILYFLLFRFMIRKFDYVTPGREDDGETKLYTRADYNEKKRAEVGRDARPRARHNEKDIQNKYINFTARTYKNLPAYRNAATPTIRKIPATNAVLETESL